MKKDKHELAKLNLLYGEIRTVLEEARHSAYIAVNCAMVQAYWRVGCLIVENDQSGQFRAEYGKAVVADLSRRLTQELGKGYSVQALRNMRQFYLTFSNRSAVQGESPDTTEPIAGQQLKKRSALRSELTWTHYKSLMRIENQRAREWYMNEAADQNWSTRQLDRQISVLYYQRLLASRDQASVKQEADNKVATLEPVHFIRDPYVLEFLNLRDYPGLRESKVEQAIIDKLQHFLLELGKGFSFVARQKRLRFEDDTFYIDLVFYNFMLKCFVLIDLKIGSLTHQDIGQMDGYVRMYEDLYKVEGDNPAIGIILCSKKNEAVAQYSVLNESKQLFASKYMLYLPTEEELQKELQRERQLIDEAPAVEGEANDQTGDQPQEKGNIDTD
jgi:predicted nuclease of restriction endonuclease-like (RecB) superfamily